MGEFGMKWGEVAMRTVGLRGLPQRPVWSHGVTRPATCRLPLTVVLFDTPSRPASPPQVRKRVALAKWREGRERQRAKLRAQSALLDSETANQVSGVLFSS